MKRIATRRGVAAGVLVALAVAGGALLLARDDERDFAGMRMKDDEVAAMVRESTGVSSLSRLPRATPEDRVDVLEPVGAGATKRFELAVRPLRWEYRDGQTIAAWGYEGQVPGPTIRVREGDRVRVDVRNELPDATTLHWHGLDVPFAQDGVPGVTQRAIAAGDSYSYEFVARPAGTRFYHAHGSSMRDEARQLDMGLSGAFIVEPRTPAVVPDREYTLLLDEWRVERGGLNAAMMARAGHAGHEAGFNLFTINGRAAPSTAHLRVKRGESVLLRLVNAGSSTTHPMHLHGHQFRIVATDGNPVPPAAQLLRNTVTVAPGETYDILFEADNPGVWMFHCHELHHADAGMMTLVQYEGREPVGNEDADAHDDGRDDAHS